MKLSFKAKLCLGVGLGFFGAALVFTQLRVLNFASLDPQLASLDREVRTLDSASPAAAADAEKKLNSVANLIFSPQKIEAWRAELPAHWSLNLVGNPEQKSVLLQRVALARPAALKSDWPEIARFLTELSARPNFCLRSLSVSSAAKSKSLNVLIVGSIPFSPN
jgi:hypothetical protein